MLEECGRTPNHEVRADEGHQVKGVNLTPIEENKAGEGGTDNMRRTPGGDRYAHGAIGSIASPARTAIRSRI
eukprot:1889360-Heterocapsa_arctica.AAC.1